ncbi:MAG: hypothetical protein HY848_16285 [Betaproteobacteria bacterium]|nr:hypothetical protein [Betaproteobacteria bacterium]
MNSSNANSGYTGLAKLLHWAVLGLPAVRRAAARMARVVQWLLYLLLVVVPILG